MIRSFLQSILTLFFLFLILIYGHFWHCSMYVYIAFHQSNPLLISMQKYSGESTRSFTKHSNCESAIINKPFCRKYVIRRRRFCPMYNVVGEMYQRGLSYLRNCSLWWWWWSIRNELKVAREYHSGCLHSQAKG